MKRLFIIKAGTTYPATARKYGDFDTWTLHALGDTSAKICTIDADNGASLPEARDCAGAIITGSHAMVTDNLPWSLRIEQWIPLLLNSRIPILGICYGHQLLARAAAGRVIYHEAGIEIGTVPIHLLPDGRNDRIYRHIPSTFLAHVSHSQSVQILPHGAVRLAYSAHEPNHSFRIGNCAWGVQFHPEYTKGIMQSYIEEQAEELRAKGMDAGSLLGTIADTPCAAQILGNFAHIVEEA